MVTAYEQLTEVPSEWTIVADMLPLYWEELPSRDSTAVETTWSPVESFVPEQRMVASQSAVSGSVMQLPLLPVDKLRQGRAVGVSVSTDPPNCAMASCVDRSVRGLSWPSNPHMDSFTTRS